MTEPKPRTLTIRPGLLLGLKTSIKGGVAYRRVDLPAEMEGEERWETTKTVDDPAELERASKVRGKASNEIRAVCAASSFGLLCPNDREAELDAALIRATDMIEKHNADAQYTRISLFAIKGRIASDDEVAAKAIASDVRDLIEDMEKGIKDLDVEAVRRAATQARSMMTVLSEEKQRLAGQAINAARVAAREIVARVQKKGEAAEKVMATLDLSAIGAARVAFLEIPDGKTSEPMPELPAVELQRFADVGEELF